MLWKKFPYNINYWITGMATLCVCQERHDYEEILHTFEHPKPLTQKPSMMDSDGNSVHCSRHHCLRTSEKLSSKLYQKVYCCLLLHSEQSPAQFKTTTESILRPPYG